MLTYADLCSEFLETQARSLWSEVWEVLAQKYKYCLGGTSTKVQILMSSEFLETQALDMERSLGGIQFTCFTSTKVQILTQKALQERAAPPHLRDYVC
jgi:hypothetical protein